MAQAGQKSTFPPVSLCIDVFMSPRGEDGQLEHSHGNKEELPLLRFDSKGACNLGAAWAIRDGG